MHLQRSRKNSPIPRFTDAEITAFRLGLTDGAFDELD
jgi:hypothetical protein